MWWNDPAGETSCEYEVLDPREDYNADRAEDGTSDDRVILVGDEHGEAEVYTCELEMLCPLTHEEFERMEWQVGRPVATPEPTPYVKKIPVMMYFTGREISFPVETVGIVPYTDSKGREVKAEDGSTVYTMGTVDSEKVAAWLDASASPGEYGNAIFNGHVSWKKVAGVFSVLPKMEEGEEIIVEYDDGSTMTFTVTNVDIYGIDDVPETVMAYDTGDSRMTLITCYGESWNSGLGTRNQRCVVVAKPVDSSKIITPPAVTPNPDEDCDT